MNAATSMRVAVTGSTGLIGRAVMARLRAAEHQAMPVLRPATGGAARPDMPAVRWDPEAGTIDRAALEGLDAVIHLAGEPIAARRWTPEHKRRITHSRTRGTSLLAEALAGLDAPPGALVSASAVGWYGSRGDERLDESSDPGDGFLARVCRDWEAAAEPARAAGIRVCHPRTGIVLSPSGGALAQLLTPFRLGLGGRTGSGRQWMSWITLQDEVSALLWLIAADVEGAVNLTAPNPVTNRHFAAALGKALRRPAVLPTPRLALRARLGGELAEALLYSSARAAPSVLLTNGFEFAHPDLEPALKSLLT